MGGSQDIPAGSIPPYRRIAERLRRAILRGDYRPGDLLPSVRQLAGQEAVNPNTVQSAYRLLEEEGWVDRQQGAGTYVRTASPIAARHRQGILRRALAEARADARRLGASEEEWRDAEQRARLRITLADSKVKAS